MYMYMCMYVHRSAQFEHTLLITYTGFDILTAKGPSSVVQWWEKTPAKPWGAKD